LLKQLTNRLRSGVPRGALLLMVISALTILTGYGREVVFAYFFGASGEFDALLVALTLPRLLVLMAANITVSVMLPVYVAHRENGRTAEASEVVRRWFWFLAAVMSAVCGGLFLLAPLVVSWMAPGLSAELAGSAESWLRWLLPYLWLSGIAACFPVILDTHRRFGAPAAANAVVNLTVMAACVLLASRMGESAVVPGFLVGAVLIFVMQWVRARPLEPAVPSLRRLSGPVELPFAGACVMSISLIATQFHLVVDRGFASTLPEGSIAALNYAKSINQVPVAVASYALATALFPVLATMTARGQWDQALRTLRRWLLIMVGVGIWPVLLLIVLREPIVSLLFERGQFGREAVVTTSSVLSVLPLTILAASAAPLVDRLLLAQRRVAVLAWMSVASIGLKVVLNVVFVTGLHMGLVGLAWATVLAGGLMVIIRYGFARSYRPAPARPADEQGDE